MEDLLKLVEEGKKIVDQLSSGKIRKGKKFVNNNKHTRRIYKLFTLLNPSHGSSVFEIGPGCCYFLYFCRKEKNCQIVGIDIDFKELQIYRLMRELLEMNDVVREECVEEFKLIEFNQKYDYIVTTMIQFDVGWKKAEHIFWVNDCLQHLNSGGKMLINFNKRTLTPEITKFYQGIGEFLKKRTVIIKKDL